MKNRLCRARTLQQKGVRTLNFQDLLRNKFIFLIRKKLECREYTFTGINFKLFLRFGHICEDLLYPLTKPNKAKWEQAEKLHNVKVNFATRFCLHFNRHL